MPPLMGAMQHTSLFEIMPPGGLVKTVSRYPGG
jgi:hypothetical protein